MNKEAYELTIKYIKAYNLYMTIYCKKRSELSSVGLNLCEIKTSNTNAGNAKFQNKVIECMELEKNINSFFFSIVSVINQSRDKEQAVSIVKNISDSRNKIVGCNVWEVAKLRRNFVTKVAKNYIGSELLKIKSE